MFRKTSFLAAAVAGVLLQAAPANAGNLEDCLSASFYPDDGELLIDCNLALLNPYTTAKDRAKVQLQIGQALYFMQSPGMAIGHLDEAIELDPSLDQAYRRRGWATLFTGFYEQAFDDFTEFLARRPDDPDASFAMAFARHQVGASCDETRIAYESILSRFHSHHITRNALASVYQCIDGNSSREIAEYDKIIAAGRAEVAPIMYYGRNGDGGYDFFANVRASRADALRSERRYSEAMSDAEWLISQYPGSARGYVIRATVHDGLHDSIRALEDSEQALAIAPYHHSARFHKLWALLHLKRYEDAVSYASWLVAKNPDPSYAYDYYYVRGLAQYRLGRGEEALHDILTAAAADEFSNRRITTQMRQSGYLEVAPNALGKPFDVTSKAFHNALEACMIDPECIRI